MKKLLYIFLLIISFSNLGYCALGKVIGWTTNAAIAYSDEDDQSYGADIHLSAWFFNGSLDLMRYNSNSISDRTVFRQYIGLSCPYFDLWQLLQFQVGFGDKGTSFRLRSNINTKEMFNKINKNYEHAVDLLYPDDDRGFEFPILSLYIDFFDDEVEAGMKLGFLWF